MRVIVTDDHLRLGKRFIVKLREGRERSVAHPTEGPLALALRAASGKAHCVSMVNWVRLADAWQDPGQAGLSPRLTLPEAVVTWILEGEVTPLEFDLPQALQQGRVLA